MDRSLRSANSLIRHRNVLTRAERLDKLKEEERWDENKSVFGLPKVAHRKQALAKAEKAEAVEGVTPAPGAAPAAPAAAGAAAGKGAVPAKGAAPAAAPAKGAAPAAKAAVPAGGKKK